MQYDDEIAERRNALMPSWPRFVRNPPTEFISQIVERSQADLPNSFLGWAPGAAIASDDLLRRAGYHPGARRPTGWVPGKEPDVFTKERYVYDYLLVRGAGEFWTVERNADEALAFEFGPTPIFTRTVEAAMYLAEYCRYGYRPRPGLRWAVASPTGILYCPEPTTWNGLQSWLQEDKARSATSSAVAPLL
jgi:hypothetical protein